MIWSISSLSAQTPTGQPQAPSVEGTSRTPAALPLSANERVLELSLLDAIRLTVQYNLDIDRERVGPQIAHTDVEKARAGYDPALGVNASIANTKFLPEREFLNAAGVFVPQRPFSANAELTPLLKQKIITGGGYEIRFVNTWEDVFPVTSGTQTRLIADPRFETAIELTLQQPLLKNFGIAVNMAPIRQAQYAEQFAEQRLLQTILNAVLDVQRSYWDLVFRIADLGAKQESQKLAEDFLAENKIRVELGTLAPIELVQAETRVKTRQGDVIVAESAVREAEDRLKEVINLPETLGTWLVRIRPTDSPPFMPLAPLSLDEQVDAALKNRPDVIQAQLDIASRQLDRDVARNQLLPQLDLQATVGVRSFSAKAEDSLSHLTEAEGYEWAVGLRFQYPLGNRFARNELQRRNLELERALVDQRKLTRTVVRELRRAVRDIETSVKRVEVTRAATVLAQTQLEAEQEKFRLGLSTSFVVLDFQEDLTVARSEETRAVSEYNVALAQLDQLTGTLRYGAAAPTKTQ
jgi:outer membrane protein TolC